MSTLPKKLSWEMAQDRWASIINPLLTNPALNCSVLKGVPLVSGDNVINTRIGRTLQGWSIVDLDAAVTIYRSAPLNDLTLTLNSSGTATVSILVF